MLNQIAVERMNSFYLTTYGMGVPFHLYVTKDMPVAKPDDLKGLRFRGQPNYNAIFKHYGIAGVNIAAPEVYTALERGVGAGLRLAAVGHQRFRLGQADQGADRSRLLQRRRQHPDEQAQVRFARPPRSAR